MDLNECRARVKDSMEKAFVTKDQESFISSKGTPLSWIFDFRPLLLDGDTLSMITELFWDTLKNELPCQVGGLETAAIALTAGLVMKAKEQGNSIGGFYIRKSRRKDGFQKSIEGKLNGEKIILVDDALNSGKSFMRQLKALDEEGRSVHAICTLIRFRVSSYYEEFNKRGIKIYSIFTLDDFPMTGGMSAVADKESPAPPKEIFKINWRFASEGPSYFHVLPKSAPAIDDNRVYFGADNGTMWALNQSDGSVAWKFATLFGAGEKRIYSSPALAAGNVYFGAYDGNVYALDAETGVKRWIFREADWIGSSPAVAPDLSCLFVGLEFGLWYKQGGLASLDLTTGEKRWWREVPSYVHSSPLYIRDLGLVVVGSSDGSVYALRAKNGAEAWRYKSDGPVRASFAYDKKTRTVAFGAGDQDKGIYILDAKSGTLKHRIETLEPIYSTPIASDGVLFYGVLDKRTFKIDIASGKITWEHWAQSRVFADPVLIDGHIYIGSNDGRLYELNEKTGECRGYFQASERIVNRIAYNQKTKRFFVPTYANELYCLSRLDT